VVSRKRSNGTFDIDYDDGEKEEEVKRELIRPLVSGLRNGGEPEVPREIAPARRGHQRSGSIV